MIYITGGLVVFFILALNYFLFRLWLESRRERITPGAGNVLYFVMRGQIKLDIWRFRLPIKITGVLEKRDNLWYISKLQFINDLNTNYVILAWVPAIALAASLVLFGLSWLPVIF